MKNIFAIITALTGALFTLTAGAETLITNEFWICDSTNTGDLGTLDNPFDGSTRTKFDTIMNDIPPYSTVHILAGTYETYGSFGWSALSGEKIIGSGIDNTILQFPSGTPQGTSGNTMIYSPSDVTNCEVSDLTCDCNWNGNGDTFCGVGLGGTRNAVRRVKVIHCGYTSPINSEAWGIVLGNGKLTSSEGNIIEECEVSEFSGGHNISAISFNGGNNGTNWVSGVMRNNRVFLTPDPSGAQFAYNGSAVYDSLIEGNYADGANYGYYSDTFGTTNTIFAHNIFKNVYGGFVFWNYTRENLTFDFNKIFLSPSNSFTAFGFLGAYHTNIVILGNDAEFDGTPSSTAYFLNITNVTGLMIGDNTLDPTLYNYLSASGLNMFNNYDLNGNYLADLNIPTVGGTEVSSFGLSLISSAEASSALTNLGLPSNPATVITNNQTGVTLSGTFNGNGNGLTNVFTASTLPIAASFVLQMTNDASWNGYAHEFHNYGIATNTYYTYYSGGPHLIITNWFSSPMSDNLYGVDFVNPSGVYGTNLNYKYMSGTTNFFVVTTTGVTTFQAGYAYVVIYR